MEPDIQRLLDELSATGRDSRAVADGLTEAEAGWRPADGSWTVAECLDHLGTANRVYLDAMEGPAARAHARGRRRRRPVRPGIVGRWFVRTLEPPVRWRVRAPQLIRPRLSPPLAEALRSFLESQERTRAFLHTHRDLDLAGVRVPNPFAPWVRFSLATSLHAITAHERRHLWQAWSVRRVAERAAGGDCHYQP